MSVFHPANVTSDGWEAPQTPQSHSPAINSCATDLIPRPSVPKSQVEVGWGCILSCMRTCCIGCILYTYSRLSSSRLACHAIQRIQRIQPYSHTRHTSYSAIQPPSGGVQSATGAGREWKADTIILPARGKGERKREAAPGVSFCSNEQPTPLKSADPGARPYAAGSSTESVLTPKVSR